VVSAFLTLGSAGAASASCNVIPQPETAFRGATASVNRVYAGDGDTLVVARDGSGCEAGDPAFAAPALQDNVATFVFTPPQGPAAAVVRASDAWCAGSFPARQAACEGQLGAGGVATCVPYSTPPSGSAESLTLSLTTEGRAGPVKVAVSDLASPLPCQIASQRCADQSGLAACIDELFAADGTCSTEPSSRHPQFPGVTALPEPNDFAGICNSPDPSIPCSNNGADVRLTTDLAGNAVVPINWTGVLIPGTLPIPRLVRGSSSLTAFAGVPPEPTQAPGAPIRVPGLAFLQSFSPKGLRLDPLFNPLFNADSTDTELFGSADAERGVIRLLRRSPVFRQCAAGSNAGLPCVDDAECPASQCGPARCRGGSRSGLQCSSDAGCPGGECGGSLFDLADRYSAGGTGPIVLTSAQYSAEAENPAAIDGLASTDDLFMLIRSEALEQKDLDGDGAVRADSVVTVRDAATGVLATIGPGGAPGRPTARVRDLLFDLPTVAIENDVVAFLEPEIALDRNADYDAFDTILRVFRLDAGGAVELTAGSNRPAEALGRVGRRSLVVSDGLVFFRESELDGVEQTSHYLETDTALPWVSRGEVGSLSYVLRPLVMTASGRFVAFVSSDQFMPEDTNSWSDVFVFDRDADADGILDEAGAESLVRVSVASNGSQGSCTSACQGVLVGPSITESGRFVAFESVHRDLVPGDTNGQVDVFVRDRDLDADGVFDEPGSVATVRVSVASDGSQAAGQSAGAHISSNGRWVIFGSSANNLDPADTDPGWDFFVRDRDADEDGLFDEDPALQPGSVATYLLLKSLGDVPRAGVVVPMAMTPDGRWVLVLPFSGADSLFDRDADADGVFDEPGETSLARVDLSTSGDEADGDTWSTAVSDDARFVLMQTSAQNLAPGNLGNAIVLRDRDADEDGIFDEPGAVSTRDLTRGQGVRAADGSLSPEGRFAALHLGEWVGPGVVSRADVETRISRYVGDTDPWDWVPLALSSRGRSLLFGEGGGAFGGALWMVSTRSDDLSRDLDGDGDVEDVLLAVADARANAPIPVSLLGSAERVAVDGGNAIFLRPEAGTGAGIDLNGDADTDDCVVHLWRNRQAGPAVNLGLAAERVAISEQAVASLASEAGKGISLNGDADLDDWVVHVAELATATASGWTNLLLAADEIQAAGSRIAFTVPEASQGQGSSLNGDADSADRVLRIYDVATQEFLALKRPDGTPIPGLAVYDFVLDERVIAFRVSESGEGQNLNGVAPPTPGGVADSDLLDGVLHVADLASGTVHSSMQAAIPCPVEACDPRTPYRVLDRQVTFLTLEADQGGNDLDESGDSGTGLVLQHFNPVALAAGGSLEEAAEVFGGALAGICTDTAEACADDASCSGGGTCYFPPGGCLLDSGVSCSVEEPVTCTSSQFCAPVLGVPGLGTCKEFQGPCLTDAECAAPATCADNGADPEALFAAVSEQPDGRQRYVSLGRCSDGDGSCRNDDDCNQGASCDDVAVIATAADPDADGLADPIDDCDDVANEDQLDLDQDGTGDACDRQSCGNGIQEYAEGCDHGGQNGLDGICDAACAYAGPGPACGDGIDNDGDGQIDLADAGCAGASDGSERDAARACDDGIDNDGDYRVDFRPNSSLDDAGCGGAAGKREDPACSDGIDNDSDGKLDWDGAGLGPKDPHCGGPWDAKETSCGIGFELVGLLPLLRRIRRLRQQASDVSPGPHSAGPRPGSRTR
jgi:hypothetical protein